MGPDDKPAFPDPPAGFNVKRDNIALGKLSTVQYDSKSLGARRRAIERIGLPAVRAHRMAQIEEEQRAWRDRLQSQARVTPEMAPLIIVHLEGGTPGGYLA